MTITLSPAKLYYDTFNSVKGESELSFFYIYIEFRSDNLAGNGLSFSFAKRSPLGESSSSDFLSI